MSKKQLNILLFESHEPDALFIREALAELEETQRGNAWLGAYRLFHVDCIEDFHLQLDAAPFDIILASVNGEDARSWETLRRVQSAARALPIVVLTPRENPALAIRLFQEGFEDILVKHEIDCSPLGRALRGAIERHRIASRIRSLAIRDELTGLLNFPGFVQMGEQLARLVARSGASAHCVLFNLRDFPTLAQSTGRQTESWLLLECAEALRQSARDGDLLAYLGQGRYAWLSLNTDESTLRAELTGQESLLAIKTLKRGYPVSIAYEVGVAPIDAATAWSLVQAMERAEQASSPKRISPSAFQMANAVLN
jgi:two-component system, cell cycle response regulator